jgi:REP element-mobilizing transposase RayT
MEDRNAPLACAAGYDERMARPDDTTTSVPMHYHLIWTTYGTWLPGDERGWMRKGEPAVQAPDPDLERACRDGMSEAMVLLDDAQQQIVATTIIAHCRYRRWVLLALAVRSNHVHAVVEADRAGGDVRNQLKAWGSRRLSDAARLTQPQTKTGGRRRWFTEGAYVRRIESDDYLQEAIAYVENQK